MSWFSRTFRRGTDPVPWPTVPRPVIRDLLFSHRIVPGKRVLDAGGDDDGLVGYLRFLGIAAEGVLDDAEIGELPEHEYDLVIVRPLNSDRENLDSQTSLLRTAGLLATVRPGGFLVLANDARQRESHHPTCLQRHLSHFPGTCRAWRRARFDLSSLKTASHGRGRLDWQTFAQTLARSLSSLQHCCPAAQQRAA